MGGILHLPLSLAREGGRKHAPDGLLKDSTMIKNESGITELDSEGGDAKTKTTTGAQQDNRVLQPPPERDASDYGLPPQQNLFSETPEGEGTAIDPFELGDNFVVAVLTNAGTASDFGYADEVGYGIGIPAALHLGGRNHYLNLELEDNDPSTVVAAVQAAYDAHIRVFVGPDTTDQALAVGQWAQQNAPDAIFFTFGATSPTLGQYPNIVQLQPTDDSMAGQIKSFQVTKEKEYVSIIHNDGAYASGLADLIGLAVGERMATRCSLAQDEFSFAQAQGCIQQVVQASPPEKTLTVILTSGRDTRELLRAAMVVYDDHYQDKILWVGGDTVAYDQTIYDPQDYEVWLGAQMVNLHGLVPGRAFLSGSDNLAQSFWNDFVVYRDGSTPTTDVSPYALLAADCASLIHILAGNSLTARGGNPKEVTNEVLRLAPFLTSYSGPLHFNDSLQRINMPFRIVRVQKGRDASNGIWALVGISDKGPSPTGKATNILEPMIPPIKSSSSSRVLKTIIVPGLPDDMSDFDLNTSVTSEIDNFGLHRQINNWDLEGNDKTSKAERILMEAKSPKIVDSLESNIPKEEEIQDFRRRLGANGDDKQVVYVYRTIVGPPALTFRPAPVAQDQCLLQIDVALTSLEVTEDTDVRACGPAHGGFQVSIVETEQRNPITTLTSLMDCNTDMIVQHGQDALDSNESKYCVHNYFDLGQSVGNRALWDQNTCTVKGDSDHSIGDGYLDVDPKLFVDDGLPMPLVDVPGLVHTYLRNKEAGVEGRDLQDIDVLSDGYKNFVRGDDWQCGCGTQGSAVTCVQMYDLMRCPRDATDLAQCCMSPREQVVCEVGFDTCVTAIAEHIKRRSHFLKRNNFQIAIHPREAFEGQVLSKSSNSSGGFQHGQGFNYRLPTCPDAVIDIEDYSYNFGDTSSSGAAAAASNMIGATTNPANTVGWLLSSSTTSQIVRMVATTGAAMALM